MERYQADNGWQSKLVPDSRALIKLGLGPDHEHLLNPESAMTSPPVPTPRFMLNDPRSGDPAAETQAQLRLRRRLDSVFRRNLPPQT